MELFKDNPNLKLKVVETVSGDKEYSINCRKIKTEYFRIGEDCHLVNAKWYRTKSGLIEFDYEIKEWVLKSNLKKLIHGVVGLNPFKLGLFSPNPYNNCQYCDGNGKYTALHPDILIQNGCIEDFSTGVWYNIKDVNVKQMQNPKNSLDHTAKGYNIEDNKDEFLTKQMLYKAYPTVLGKEVKNFGNMLGDTTFGIELECSAGNIPDYIQNRTGVVICRDGSLKDENGKPGPEFVTIPYQGAKGLQSINTLTKELSKRTKLNISCSLHIHYGTLPITRTYLVSVYKLCSRIQNEIFTMFPYYKTNPDGIKNKNYNKKLPSLGILKKVPSLDKDGYHEYIDSSYKQIFSWLAEGYIPDRQRNRKNKKHPSNDKWNRHERYYWINFMNTIFSERNTLEFRLHGPTTNNQKTVNWLFICNAILKYALTNSNKILLTNCAISLNDVLGYYKRFGVKGEFLTRYLIAYVDSRKNSFLEDYKKGDLVSEWDYKNDSDYKFTFENVTSLF